MKVIMDKMTLFSILTVSVPEAILNIYLGFLVMGEKTHLYLVDRINVIRLTIAVCLMVSLSVLSRAIFPNLVIILLCNIITYAIVIMCTYRMKWSKALFIVLIFLGFLMTIEIVYTPLFMYVTNINTDQLLQSDFLRLAYTLIERAIQVFVIISLWNWNRVFLKLKSYKEVRVTFCLYMLLLLLVEIVFFSAIINHFPNLPFNLKLIYSVGGFLFSIINFYFFKLLTVLANAVLKQEMLESLQYKKEIKNNFIAIHKLLEKGDVELAKKVCENSIVIRYGGD